MRTGSSCNVRNVYRKSQPVRISIGIKVNRCLRPTLQITKFQAFSAPKTKLGTHLDRVATEAYAHGGLCPRRPMPYAG